MAVVNLVGAFCLKGDCLLDHCLYPWLLSICEGQVDVVDLRRTNLTEYISDGNNHSGFSLSDSSSKEKPTIVLMSSAVSRSKCEEASSAFVSVETQYSYTLCRS